MVSTEWGSRKLYCGCNSEWPDPQDKETWRNVDLPEDNVKCRCCTLWPWFYIDSEKGRNYQRRLKDRGIIC